jgi:hypothetical protein
MTNDKIRDRLLQTYKGDEKVLLGIAHGHEVHVGSISEIPKEGAYNLLLPKETDEDKIDIMNAQAILVECSDRRQSKETYDEITKKYGKIVTLAVAAGPSQPEVHERNLIMADYLKSVYEINPKIVFVLIAHDQQCGGLKLMTSLYDTVQKGSKEEGVKVNAYTQSMKKELLVRNILEDQIVLGLTHIDSQDTYTNISWVDKN